jgi:hypothetical protein
VSTPSCWYDHRYHQTCLECLLSFVEPWIPSFDGMMDDDQDVPPYVFAATGPSFSSSYRTEPSQQVTNLLYRGSSILFFSNGILDLCYHPRRSPLIALSVSYSMF